MDGLSGLVTLLAITTPFVLGIVVLGLLVVGISFFVKKFG